MTKHEINHLKIYKKNTFKETLCKDVIDQAHFVALSKELEQQAGFEALRGAKYSNDEIMWNRRELYRQKQNNKNNNFKKLAA